MFGTFAAHGSPKRRLSAKVAPALALAAMMAVGAFPLTASADNNHNNDHHNYHHYNGWDGGYYRPPPVVYPYSGYGYYAPAYPPPVVYGPGVGINLPGLSIGIGVP